MFRKIIASVLVVITLFSFIACNDQNTDVTPSDTTTSEETTTSAEVESTTTESETTTKKEEETPKKPEILDNTQVYNILFVGNSYTHYNTMPESIFFPIGSNGGYRFNVTRITKGGWYLIDSANPSDEVGAKVEAAFKNNKYDFVVLQEQSTCPALSPGKFYDGVRAMVEKVRANGATPILYGTWGRKTGHSVLTTNNWTHQSMTWKISAAYEAIGKELGIDVAQAGFAFNDVYTNNANVVDIYDEDLTHPSYAGSYLAAMTIFAKITGVDPTTLTYNGTLTPAVADILRTAASKAVFNPPSIPAEYKTSSEGVHRIGANYTVDTSKMKNLTTFPSSPLISVLKGGTYPNGKTFSGILGTKGQIASKKYSTSGLSDADKADIADITYGVSVIGIEKMFSSSKGYTTAVENLVNGSWNSAYMACWEFDDNKYNIKGEIDPTSDYTGLITLNFGSKHKFDTIGFASGSLQGFPGVAEVYVSDDGVNWTLVPTACWDNVNGKKLVSCGKTPADPWSSAQATVTCLFDMGGVSGQYIRIGVVIGRNDTEDKYNTINTREILVYGKKES